jgi:hypothetical protein
MMRQPNNAQSLIDSENEFQTVAPKILYFGTPVAIVSSANPCAHLFFLGAGLDPGSGPVERHKDA